MIIPRRLKYGEEKLVFASKQIESHRAKIYINSECSLFFCLAESNKTLKPSTFIAVLYLEIIFPGIGFLTFDPVTNF